MKTRNIDLTQSARNHITALLLGATLSFPVEVSEAADVDFQVVWAVAMPDAASVGSVVVRDDLIFCALTRESGTFDPADFHIGKISGTNEVEWLGSVTTQGEVASIVLLGSTVFIADGTRSEAGNVFPGEGLISVDISDPAQPRRLDVLPMNDLWPDSSAVFASPGERVYVSLGSGRLAVVDVSNPSQLRLLGVCPLDQYLDFVWVLDMQGDTALVKFWDNSSGGYRFGTLDVSNWDAPVELQSIFDINEGHVDRIQYLSRQQVLSNTWTDQDFGVKGLELFDIGSPITPVKMGTLGVIGNVVGVEDGWVYGVDRVYDGTEVSLVLSAYRISGPSNPQRIGHLDSSWNRVVVRDRFAFVATCPIPYHGFNPLVTDGLTVIDVSDPAVPLQVGALSQASLDIGGYVQQLYLDGIRLFVVGEERIRVLDVTNPIQPVDLGAIPVVAKQMAIASGLLFVLEPSRWAGTGQWIGGGLTIMDIGSLASPIELGAFRPGFEPGSMFLALAVAWPRAYLVANNDGLAVVDVSDSSNPTWLSRLSLEGGGLIDVDVTGEHVLIANGAGLLTIDVADAENPKVSATLRATPSWFPNRYRGFQNIAIHGDYAYLLDSYGGGLVVADISDPARPRIVGRNGASLRPVNSGQIAVTDEHVYFALQHEGLIILNKYTELRIGPAIVLSDGRVLLQLSGPSGQCVRVQRSANLVDWEDWRTVTLDGTGCELIDENAAASQRFYKAIAQ